MESDLASPAGVQIADAPSGFPAREQAVEVAGSESPIGGVNATYVAIGTSATISGPGVATASGQSASAKPAEVALTPLQVLIHQILDPQRMSKRPVKEWRSLYRAFFEHFSPTGKADELERDAWAIAFAVFNRNLVAVNNRTTQVVPMTFQDFVDGVDSFRLDGLLENSRRDIVWQPKKILLSMAAMIGRIVAGRLADELFGDDPGDGTGAFRNHLIHTNRKANFLGHVFDHDARFSLLQYRAAGLQPLLQAFPHCAYAVMENGLQRCEIVGRENHHAPALLRLQFLRPLRVPVSLRSISTLDVLPLKAPLPSVAGGCDPQAESSYLDGSPDSLQELAFEGNEAMEVKRPKMEHLFELALQDRLAICASHRAGAPTAKWTGAFLGRTQPEQFATEQFFALGFKSGSGNEPWGDQSVGEKRDLNPEKLKQARKQFGHWWDTVEFFSQAGAWPAAGIPGARTRQAALQPKGNGSPHFLVLLRTPVLAPLMDMLLALDGQGSWLVKEPDFVAIARGLGENAGRMLLGAAPTITQCADSFPAGEARAVFLFECSLALFNGLAAVQKSPLKQTKIEEVRDALRRHYASLLQVSLANAPSALWSDQQGLDQQLQETRHSIQRAEQAVWELLGSPIAQKVAEPLKENLERLAQARGQLQRQMVPVLELANQAALDRSLIGLRDWAQGLGNPSPTLPIAAADDPLWGLAEARSLAEAGEIVGAMERAACFFPLLTRKKKEHLATFFSELPSLILGHIEQELQQGQREKAYALAAKAKLLLEGQPGLSEYEALLQELFRPKQAAPASAAPGSTPRRTAPCQPLNPRIQQAEKLLSQYSDELAIGENGLEREFLQAIVQGSEAAFHRKTKLAHRLQKLTQWGGREPHMTTLRLLRTALEGENI